MQTVLVNTNLIRPPIASVGIDYVAESLGTCGHEVSILDLCWVGDTHAAIQRFFHDRNGGLVGVSLRNTDDCAFGSRASFLVQLRDIVSTIRHNTAAPIFVGGGGFSVMPEAVLKVREVDGGLWREGEFALRAIATRVERHLDWHDVPGVAWRDGAGTHRKRPAYISLANLPAMTRRWGDNPRYLHEGGPIGFERKRGRSHPCTHCARPVAKGNQVRTRPPKAAADALQLRCAKSLSAARWEIPCAGTHTANAAVLTPRWRVRCDTPDVWGSTLEWTAATQRY
ncbi:MAG: hypothetical protein AUJ92_01150 [Armatimonadetes bacterium CG2_30_59_28]|nr:hypothetical protein [Armatimonadota bacterium]OIO98579.1 MAG: hypothetical protein AUJ92_01150 [Armatimonadetes bacterium CG2_30_59_28]PIU64959.1 MAG: hypothetical protein COS85_10555 [Armatimonadetes bacterium CG07_land_8_20_14_0_80_59_28]PIX41672.1 MAG: hypothetical protein COZ56_11320 [Armatimonadetes bacterium CG_4_8_14_3_um_filter_58_9]PIY41457.1 MAG: hypothetical protein COZ05_15670 [Armatimonadetes bacterium CG_4_10_14_3_um_filter_59_10]PJB68125.1 MAG: hypothetical protein CO095_114